MESILLAKKTNFFMKKITFSLYLLGLLISPFLLFAQADSPPLKIKQIQKYGALNQLLFDSITYQYNDKNQLTRTNEHLFFAVNPNDLIITDFEYNAQGLNTINCTNEFKKERLKEGHKEINVFDAAKNLISTTYQQNRGGQFFNTYRVLNQYDEVGNLITATGQDWVYIFPNRTWQNVHLESMAYNANGQVVCHTKSNWEEDKWLSQNKTTSVYTEKGDVLYFALEFCQAENCILFKNEIYEYDEAKRVIFQAIRKEILYRPGWFVDSTLTQFRYHANGQFAYQKDSTLIRRRELGTFWNSGVKEIYYDTLGNLTKSMVRFFDNEKLESIKEEILDSTSNNRDLRYQIFVTDLKNGVDKYLERVKSTRFDEKGNKIASCLLRLHENGDTAYLEMDTLVYDAHNRLIFQREDALMDGVLMPWTQSIYEFNEIGLLLKSLRQSWKEGRWLDDWYTIHQYDDQYNLQFTERYTRNAPNNLLNSQFNNFYTLTYYQAPLSVSTIEIPDNSITIFPNPAQNVFYLQLGDQKLLGARFTFFNSNGQLILDGIIQNQRETIELPTLPSGQYFLQLRKAEIQITKKLMIVH